MEPLESAAGKKPDADPRRDAACRAAARDLAHGGDARVALDGCDDVRSELGGWLVPLTLLGVLRERTDDVAASLLASWLETHGHRLLRAERAATRDEILEGRLTDAQKERATRALERGEVSTSAVALALRGVVARDALARGPDARGVVSWKASGTLGVLRMTPAGGAVGFVVDPAALGRGLAGRVDPAASTRLRVVTAEPAPLDEPRTLAWIGPGLGVEATLRAGGELGARTQRSRLGLWAVAGGSASVALLFAVLLFSRLRAARRTSELRTSFAAALSHELRTPIASIRMLAELLESDRAGDEEERQETVSAIARESRRLGDTVSRLLAWSRMSAGQTRADRRTSAVGEIVEDAIDVFVERNPDVRVERDIERTATLALDPPLVQLAVMNLLENARKYAPTGGPYRVSVRRVEARVRIEVADRGPGVPRKNRERIFEAFERGDDRLSRATDGTGIGLALVRAVARAHGGDASLDDTDVGARFVIELRDAPAVAERGDGAGSRSEGAS